MAYSALILISASCDVKSSFIESHRGDISTRFFVADETRLRPDIETTALRLMDDVERGVNANGLLALIDHDFVMRISPLTGGGEKTYALVVESDGNRQLIARAVNRYRLTSRQSEVLLLVIDGANAGEVARALHISEYTAQGYIKTLLAKTGSRNRAALVATILDWSTPPASPQDATFAAHKVTYS